jgi:hypothetical protein
MSQRVQILGLYRRLLRYGDRLVLTDKNYFCERVRKDFHRFRTVTDQKVVDLLVKVCCLIFNYLILFYSAAKNC